MKTTANPTGKMYSKAILVPMLINGSFIASEKSVSYEAYGRKVVAYITCSSQAARAALEDLLEDHGQKVNRRYWLGSATAAVQVTYFKAWHWDE